MNTWKFFYLPYFKDLVVHGDEKGREVLGLGQMVVEAVVEAVHDAGPDVGVRVGDADDEEFGQDVVDLQSEWIIE